MIFWYHRYEVPIQFCLIHSSHSIFLILMEKIDGKSEIFKISKLSYQYLLSLSCYLYL